MPIFRLNDELVMPPPELAEEEGLLAVGGDLRVERLVLAYCHGIFPWFSEGDEILWWSPDPRCVIDIDGLHVSRRLARTLRRGDWTVAIDRQFEQVLHHCASVPRPEQDGTWLVDSMRQAYTRLHVHGIAHSVEVYADGELAGGLYGVALGRAFFGESMFSLRRDASKVAMVRLFERMREHGFTLFDCQVPNDHLFRLGARLIPRREFLLRVREATAAPEPTGMWPNRRR